MKIRVTMKNPDVLHDAVRDAVKRELDNHVEEFTGTEYLLAGDELASLFESRCDKHYEECARWFRYGEYLTVEIDTSAMTCVVVEAKS